MKRNRFRHRKGPSQSYPNRLNDHFYSNRLKYPMYKTDDVSKNKTDDASFRSEIDLSLSYIIATLADCCIRKLK